MESDLQRIVRQADDILGAAERLDARDLPLAPGDEVVGLLMLIGDGIEHA